MKKCIAAGCMIVKDGKVLMLKHKRLNTWLYPGGHAEQNETPIETAMRETFEETGMKVSVIDVGAGKKFKSKIARELPRPLAIVLERVPYPNGAHIHFDMIYLAVPKSKGNVQIRKDESNGFRWVSATEMTHIKTYNNVKEVALRALRRAKAF